MASSLGESTQKTLGILNRRKYHIGADAPKDKRDIWIDTSDEMSVIDADRQNISLNQVTASLSTITNKINNIEFAFANEISFGNFSNNVKSAVSSGPTEEPLSTTNVIRSEIVPLKDGTYKQYVVTSHDQDFSIDSSNVQFVRHIVKTEITHYKDLNTKEILDQYVGTHTEVTTKDANDVTYIISTEDIVESNSKEILQNDRQYTASNATIDCVAGSTTELVISKKTSYKDTDDEPEHHSSVVLTNIREESTSDSITGAEYTFKYINTIKDGKFETTFYDANGKEVPTQETAAYAIHNLVSGTGEYVGETIECTRVVSKEDEEKNILTHKVTTTQTSSSRSERYEDIKVYYSGTLNHIVNTDTEYTIYEYDTTDVYFKRVFDDVNKNGAISNAPFKPYYEFKNLYDEYKETSLQQGIIVDEVPLVVTGPFSNSSSIDLDEIKEYTPNAKHLRIKSGTYRELQEAIKSEYGMPFLSGELLYCYDVNKLYICNPYGNVVQISSSGGDGESIGGASADLSNVEEINFTANVYGSQSPVKYNVRVDKNGELICYPKVEDIKIDAPVDAEGTKTDTLIRPQSKLFNQLLFINTVYCGGVDSDEFSYNYCDYNFVELSNMTDHDINLNGLTLQYSTGGNKWVALPLQGTIKCHSTYLVRGAKCSVSEVNTTVIKVGKPDLEWYDNNNQLIKFSNKACKFMIMYNDPSTCNSDGTYQGASPMANADGAPTASEYGLVDLLGLSDGTNAIDAYAGASYNYLSSGRLITRYFSMDHTKQAAGDRTANLLKNQKNNSNWCYVDLTTLDTKTGFNSKGVRVADYTPKARADKKNVFFNKTRLDEELPNMVTCSFGINATDPNSYEMSSGKIKTIYDYNGNVVYTFTWSGQTPTVKDKNNKTVDIKEADFGATRCFNWVSKNYFDEYLFYRKKGESTWTKVESFKASTINDRPERHRYSVYDRQRIVSTSNEPFTSHKYILTHLIAEPGNPVTYEYKVGREGYESEVYTFTVRNSKDVDNFGFIHVSDQQGFNEYEYRVWGRVADYIANVEQGQQINSKLDKSYLDNDHPTLANFDFVVNTGDMTQNGNRLNEWLDYYKNGKALYKNYEQMYVIGNNDLCPAKFQGPNALGDGQDVAKINGINFQFFFTYEFDPKNKPIVIDNKDPQNPVEYFIHSLYSFNYGTTHFMAVNSEITTSSKGDGTIELLYGGNNAYVTEKSWCEYDAEHLPSYIKWKIAYCHEQPFTILTSSKFSDFAKDNSTSREGSHLNTVYGSFDLSEKCWFSRYLENYGYKLCLCGHKHTYSESKPLRENYEFRWEGSNVSDVLINGQVYKSSEVYLRDLCQRGLITEADTKNAKMVSIKDFVPIIQQQQGNAKDIITSTANEGTYLTEELQKYNAPLYVMCQASGYKLTSNKELPGADNQWLRTYYPANGSKANNGQKYPFYIKWNVTNDYIRGETYRVKNAMSSSGTFSVNDGSYGDIYRITTDSESSSNTPPIIISKENTVLEWQSNIR